MSAPPGAVASCRHHRSSPLRRARHCLQARTSPEASAATSGTKDYAHLSCELREGGLKLSLPCNPDDEACFPAFKACRSHLRSASRNADTMLRLLPPTGECGHSIFTASTPFVHAIELRLFDPAPSPKVRHGFGTVRYGGMGQLRLTHSESYAL